MAEITRIGRVRVASESTFGADGTGTIGNFFGVRVDTIEAPGPVKPALEVDPLRSFRGQEYVSEFGPIRGQLTAGGDLCSIGTAIANGVTTTKDGISKLFEKIVGGYRTGEGSDVASGASATSFSVSAGDGAQLLDGQIVAIETTNGGGTFLANVIATRSTDALTTLFDHSGTPATGADVLNSQMIYETDQPTGSVQWLVEHTRDRDDIYLYLGCQGNLSLTWPLGGKVTWQTQQQVTKYLHDDELATPQGGSSMSIYSLDAGTPVIANAGSIHFGPASATTRVNPTVLEITFDPGIAWQEIPSFNGTEARAGWEQLTGKPMGTITVLGGTETYKDARDAQTIYSLLAQAGTTGGKMLALFCPRVQIVGIEEVEVGGLKCEKLTFECLAASQFPDQSTDVRRYRWALGRM